MSSTKIIQPFTLSDQKLAARCARGRIVIIDDDDDILAALSGLIKLEGYACETYPSALAYLEVLNYNRPHFPGPSCVLCDVKMPELDGLELQSRLATLEHTPFILMSGISGAQEAIHGFRAGAFDFLIKPIEIEILLKTIQKALLESTLRQSQQKRDVDLHMRIASLTPREREIAKRVSLGHTNPAIAEALGIGLRTVKLHRQRAFEKMGAQNTADFIRLAYEGDL